MHSDLRRGYLWALLGTAAATACFWLLRHSLDKGQASLLYLPLVIACAIRFGFGPAVTGAVLSFLCWDFFFLPPFGTFVVHDPRDWLSLLVFLIAAVATGRLAARARRQTLQAQTREAEITTLFQAGDAVSRELHADRLLSTLAEQLLTLAHTTRCLIFRHTVSDNTLNLVTRRSLGETADDAAIARIADTAFAADQTIGFGQSDHLWQKALTASQPGEQAATPSDLGAYIPLHAEGRRIGLLHIGPQRDRKPFSTVEKRLILTLANYAAIVLAREDMAAQAAQATALHEADLLKDSLLSLVSHELRSPLATIKASASGLLQPEALWERPAITDALSSINRETDRLTHLVSNLLDLSRLEAGAWRPSKDWCDLEEVVGTTLDRLPPTDAARVHVEAAPGMPLVRADYLQLVLVLANLLENAAKYAPPDLPITLTLTGSAPDTDPPCVTFSVRDSGPGIPPGEETRLFDRFYRGPLHQNSTIHGTGLGLALCRAIVLAHGGDIMVRNMPPPEGTGAIFTVRLPVNESEANAAPAEK